MNILGYESFMNWTKDPDTAALLPIIPAELREEIDYIISNINDEGIEAKFFTNYVRLIDKNNLENFDEIVEDVYNRLYNTGVYHSLTRKNYRSNTIPKGIRLAFITRKKPKVARKA